MSAEIIQFVPRPNPNRDVPIIELTPLQVDALAIVGDIMSNLQEVPIDPCYDAMGYLQQALNEHRAEQDPHAK